MGIINWGKVFDSIGSSLICVATIITVTGCSSSQSKKGYCHEKGNINAHIYNPTKNPCEVSFRYRNLSKHTQKPIVDIISYNDAEQIIKHDTIHFSELGSGASEQLAKTIECKGEKISKVYIRDARNAARCYDYKCSVLCGIQGLTIPLSK